MIFLRVFKNDSSPVNSLTQQSPVGNVFPTRSLHTYLSSLTCSSTVKDMFRSASVELGTDISLEKGNGHDASLPAKGARR